MVGMKIKILERAKHLPKPQYKTAGAAAFDLHVPQAATLNPGQVARLAIGLVVAIPQGFVGLIKSRSSWNLKGLRVDGVIDSDYRGEISLICQNVSNATLTIPSGERIGQMLIQPVVQIEFEEVDELDETERGAGGFGSTGR